MTRRLSLWLTGLALVLTVSSAMHAQAASVDELIATIKSVDREGKGNVEAQQAMRQLSRLDAAVFPKLLRSFGDASPLAANWLRSAFETIADRELKSGRSISSDELEKFVLDRDQNARARRLAYEWLTKVDDDAVKRLMPSMLDDPSAEMRRDVVARLIDDAKALEAQEKKSEADDVYQKALSGAVDGDQVKLIVDRLREFGHEIDLQRHFGFLPNWSMIGPFDNREKIGFAAVYPPETELDLSAKYEGQLGPVTWTPLETDDDYGTVNIADQISPYKGAVMYAATDFQSERRQKIQLRLGTPNAWVLWINGKRIFAREEYHRGTAMDQYRVPVVLKPGRNAILLKVCQNEQTQNWAQDYKFQLRLCDATGNAILPDDHPGDAK